MSKESKQDPFVKVWMVTIASLSRKIAFTNKEMAERVDGEDSGYSKPTIDRRTLLRGIDGKLYQLHCPGDVPLDIFPDELHAQRQAAIDKLSDDDLQALRLARRKKDEK